MSYPSRAKYGDEARGAQGRPLQANGERQSQFGKSRGVDFGDKEGSDVEQKELGQNRNKPKVS